MRTPIACCLMTVVLALRAEAAIIYVDDSAIGGANDGSSWQNAFLDLQHALAIAIAGDEIRIAQGTYKPAPPGGPREATFQLRLGVTVQGGYSGVNAPDPDALDPSAFVTTLSGDLSGDDLPNFGNYAENSYHVVTADAVDATAVLLGVTITAGNANWGDYGWPVDPRSVGGGLICVNGAAPTLGDCTVREDFAFIGGGGVYAPDGLHLNNCTFVHNSLHPGAGGAGGALSIASGDIVDCTFQANGSLSSAVGGAVYGSAALRRCRFIGNGSNEAAGALAGSFVAIDCDFIGNGAYHGAGVFWGSNSTFINCRFLNNGSACYSFVVGSVMDISGSSQVINCLFSGNEGSFAALAVDSEGDDPVLVANCTFVGNTSLYCSGAAVAVGPKTSVINCILWDNLYKTNDDQASQIDVTPSTVLAYNAIQGWDGSLGGVGNHGNDPRFVDADGADDVYGTADDNPRLRANSPCIDTGDMLLLPPDTFDLDEDGDVTEPLPIDLDDLPRVVGANVDSGAFEFQGARCRADIDGNSAVDVDDLITVILAWGACTVGETCHADLDLNMQVDVDDLIAVILGWGACP